MRREVLFNAAQTIVEDLQSCGVSNLMEELFRLIRSGPLSEKEHPRISLEVFRAYSLATSRYTEVERDICNILGINKLLDTDFWEELAESIDPSEIFKMHENLGFVIDQLPKLLGLIKQGYVDAVRNEEKDIPDDLEDKTILTVIVVEEEGQFSNPERLTTALSAIAHLYKAHALLRKRGGKWFDCPSLRFWQ